jgi:hypothetical protein
MNVSPAQSLLDAAAMQLAQALELLGDAPSGRTVKSLLEVASFSLARARACVGAPGVALGESVFDRFVRCHTELAASDHTPDEQAAEYEHTARIMRNRHPGDPETEARAQWFERRAKHKREGSPMPFDVRTAAERLAYVDVLRRELVDVALVFGLISAQDVAMFAASLEGPAPALAPGQGSATAYAELVGLLGYLLTLLGARRDEQGAIQLAPYRKIPIGPPPPAILETSSPETSPATTTDEPAVTTNGVASA